MFRLEIFTFQETNTARRVAALHLYDFMTDGTLKMRWILLMGGNMMAGI